MGKKLDLTGLKVGRLTALSCHGKNDFGKITWLCKCDCGETAIVIGSRLKSGLTKSCGCLRNEKNPINCLKHGLTGTPLQRVFNSMKQRCYNPNNEKYKIYGARGIKICDEWLSDIRNFVDWAYSSGYKKGLTIDRVDVNGDYKPSNCRWATKREQANNTRRNHFVLLNGKRYTVANICRKYNIDYNQVLKKLSKGTPIEEII